MSDGAFDKAIALMLEHEGGLVDDPADPGGFTNFGISLRNHPELTRDDIRFMTRDKAAAIYRREYWLPGKFALLPDVVAVKAFDAAVNIGIAAAARCVQRACRACGEPVTEDGAIGPETAKAASAAYAYSLLTSLASEIAGHYRTVAAKNPALSRFLNGWLARAYGEVH